MKERALVSVIVPCYNCDKYITETLDSIKDQTYSNIEIVCVNDGSNDKTREELAIYSSKNLDLDIKIIDEENRGVSFARNNGIKHSNGDYIVFIDSDDKVNSHFIELLVLGLEEHNADTAFCKLTRDFDRLQSIERKSPFVLLNQYKAMSMLMHKMGDIGFSCYIYKKSIILEHNLFFQENVKRFEDREFNWKYLTHCNHACFIGLFLYWYRINEKSETKKIYWSVDSIEAAIRVEHYLRDNGIHFYKKLKKYLVARVVWGVTKNYALGKRKDLFDRIGKEYNVKKYMRQTFFDRNPIVSLLSLCYLISPRIFYFLIGLKS